MVHIEVVLPDEIAEPFRYRAESKGLTIAQYLTELAIQDIQKDWPTDFFTKVVGAWKGEGIERPEQLPLEERETLR